MRSWWLSLLIFCSSPVQAEQGYETVVTASRSGESAFESPRAVDVVNRAQIDENTPTTTPQALENEPGVTMQRTSSGGGAPIIRGLLGQHVLLLIDGVRMNNAITRFGPNQLLNSIDPFQLQRVEVMRGPASVLYGSDALGGVINLITRKPSFDPRRAWDAAAEARGRFDSASMGVVGNLALEGHLRGLGLRVAGTGKHFGELLGGRDTGLQRFTAYREGDADVAASWEIDEHSTLGLSFSTVRQHDAPRTDRSSPGDFRLFTDQLRDYGGLRFRGRYEDFFIKEVNAGISLSNMGELRERFRLAQDRDRIERERDDVLSLGAQVGLRTDLPWKLGSLRYGVELYNDWVGSSAEYERISVAIRTPQDRGRYVDGSRYLQLGVYLLDHISVGEKLAFDLGGRVSSWSASVPRDAGTGMPEIDTTNAGVVGSLHGRYLMGDGLNLVAGVSQGFRAPNIDDYTAQGCSGQGYDLPNADLRPEKSVTTEAGVKLDLFGRLTGSLFYYFTYLDDLIVRVTVDGSKQTDRCGGGLVNVLKRDNAKTGNIHGVELSLRLALGRGWTLYSWAAWALGRVTLVLPNDLELTEPLGRVPPLNGMAGVRYDVADDKGFVELAVRWATRQDRLSFTDLGDKRICPGGARGCDGTPGYAVVTLRGAARLHKYLRLTASVQNLTDETYRVHGSGIDGPGLSALLGMEVVLK
jgi:outer membrane receptor protein involved in Fe transport